MVHRSGRKRRHGDSRVAKVVLVSAVTPSVLQTDANPAGTPQAAFEGLQAGLAANRSEFYRAVASGPFYNFDQPGVEASEAVIANWWHSKSRESSQRVDCPPAAEIRIVGHNPRYGMGNDPRSWQRRLPGTAGITSAAPCEASGADVTCPIGPWTLTVAMTPVSVHDHDRYLR